MLWRGASRLPKNPERHRESEKALTAQRVATYPRSDRSNAMVRSRKAAPRRSTASSQVEACESLLAIRRCPGASHPVHERRMADTSRPLDVAEPLDLASRVSGPVLADAPSHGLWN